jgi:ribosome biogenesis GTPase
MVPAPPASEPPSEQTLWGTVLAAQANFYHVRLDARPDLPTLSVGLPVEALLCTRRARLKKMGQQVMVGDRVAIEEPDWDGGRGAISAIAPRHSQLDRPPVANANQILLVFSLAEPDLEPHQLSRFLVKAETTGMTIVLVLNKQDLVPATVVQTWCDRIQAWGYAPIPLSVQQDAVWESLLPHLRDRTSIISGPSGVGKSSLINRLIPQAQLRTNRVSGKLGRGRHTTRHVELFQLPGGGLLADTPGFNQPEIDCAPARLAQCFPEIQRQLQVQTCQFADCLHQGEPGCTVSTDWARYEDYLALLAACVTQQQQSLSHADENEGVKTKVGEDGKTHQEPRLAAKKYRRVSRRSRKQSLDELRYELGDALTGLDADDWEEDVTD